MTAPAPPTVAADPTVRPARAPRGTRSAARRGRRDKDSVLRHVLLLAACSYFLLPVYWVFVASTKSTGELFDSPGLWFGRNIAIADNIRDLMNHDNGVYLRWLLNSLLYSGVGAAVATIIAAMAGYVFSRFEFAFKSFLFNVILGAVMVPATALALPLYLMFSRVGLTNSYWSVLLPSLLSPLGVYLIRIYTDASVPMDLLEAARVDGAGEWYIFQRIATRLISPAMVTVFLFQFVTIWNNFFLPLVMLSDSKKYPVTLGLHALNVTPAFGGKVYYNLVITGSMLSILPLIAGFLLLQRYWRSGLGMGSVVG